MDYLNIYIRSLQTEDAKASWKWRNDPEVWKFTGSKPDRVITEEIEAEWVQKVLKDDSSERFAIIADGVYIGNIQLTNITEHDAEYHIFIGDRKYWGKGIAKIATYQILHYAKYTLNLQCVNLSVREENKAAVKVYEKTGFVVTGNEDGWTKMFFDLKNLVPVVSIFVMVYNHEPYLRECLDSLLMQKCDFPYNIVVGEDKSTDNSRDILLEYNEKFPGYFKLLLHEKNIGAHANQNSVFKNCDGKYIAMCEGDDYWIDDSKIQKQVDFLEKNAEYFGSQHGRIVLNDQGEEKVENYYGHIFTQCVVFKNELSKDFFETLYNSKILNADVMLEHFLKSNGKFKYFDFLGAVYRFNGSGVFSSLKVKERQKEGLRSAVTIIDFLKKSEYPLKNKQIKELQKQYLELYYALLQSGEKPYNLQDYLKQLFIFKEFNKHEFLKVASYISRKYIKQRK